MTRLRLEPSQRQFQDRVATQFRARYPGWEFSPSDEAFAIRGRQGKAAVSLVLDPLYAKVRSPGASVPEAIMRFVSEAAPRLSAAADHPEQAGMAPDPEALVWCVREERSTRAYSRFAELALRELPGGLVAFVAEALPGEVMQGVSRAEAELAGLSEADLRQRADRNTELRLTQWQAQLEEPGERQSWLFSSDSLFSSSLLLLPAFLERLSQLGQGRAALAVPDRAVVVAAVGGAARPETLRPVVRRLYRLAAFPLSPLMLATDGEVLEVHPAEQGALTAKMIWRRLFGSSER